MSGVHVASLDVWQKNCNKCSLNKLACLVGIIRVAKWTRAEDAGTEGGKSLKKTWVKESEAEAELGLGESDEGDLGMQITQDLSLMLLGIPKEMAVQSALMCQMLHVHGAT